MPYPLARFGFSDMMECRARIRAMFEDEPPSVAAAAERIVRFLHEELVDDRGQPACALVRFFKTHLFRELDDELQAFARRIAPDADAIPELRCLTLVATAGDLPEWRSRHDSRGHKAIPLVSEEMVEQAPMIAQLIKELGLEIAHVMRPDPLFLLGRNDANYNVFHVPVAAGSPHIVAQDFVAAHAIASVLGFGGLVSNGDLFAVVMFSKVTITPEVADLFRILGLNLKVVVLPVVRKPLF